MYCCSWCRGEAWKQFHRILCPGSTASFGSVGLAAAAAAGGAAAGAPGDGGAAFELWIAQLPAGYWPFFVGAFRLALRLAAWSLQEEDGDEGGHGQGQEERGGVGAGGIPSGGARELLAGLCGTEEEEAARLCPELGEGAWGGLLRAVRAAFGLPLVGGRDEVRGAWLDTRWLQRAVSALAQNALHLQPLAPFGAWYAAAKRSGSGTEARVAVDVLLLVAAREAEGGEAGPDEGDSAAAAVAERWRGADAFFRERVGVDALGIFPLHACLNHSCSPNCEARSYCFATHSVDVVATRAVARGEQLSISYVDATPGVPGHVRRAKLQRAYLFKCGCERCTVGK